MGGPRFTHTTILCVRKDGLVALGGDGQVTMGTTIMKSGASKVRRLLGGKVLAGFAGSTADAVTLFTRFERKLEEFHGQLERAAVELATDWRTEKTLRQLEALLVVADEKTSLLLSGTGTSSHRTKASSPSGPAAHTRRPPPMRFSGTRPSTPRRS